MPIIDVNQLNNVAQATNIAGNIGNTPQNIDLGVEKSSFANVLSDALDKVNQYQEVSSDKTEQFIKGENVSMHEVMLAGQEAQISMQLLIEVRNKIYDAYQEMYKVQI
ncbi:flagellar hook-basal body complex protein FliE [Metaclostridioides mangenotii]|uniref:flagellar hook-basal body complex protein FliE n=1 Tax=Metaclostridioides mangenotii TaxID=1540 RepID=UPI0004849AAB|nr:flagellar hook-basal body complex protein FliE [Clostridioides mangenotii]